MLNRSHNAAICFIHDSSALYIGHGCSLNLSYPTTTNTHLPFLFSHAFVPAFKSLDCQLTFLHFVPVLTDRNNKQWVARANKYYQIAVTAARVKSHIVTEEFAVDSYQNLLFSLLRYYTILKRWPKHITLISHDFKKHRFIDLHLRAIRWPIDRFTFVGIDPLEFVVSRLDLDIGEENKGFGSWQKDPYAAQLFLQDKRETRGWNPEQLSEICHSDIPVNVKSLVFWNGGATKCEWYTEPLPWNQ